MTNTTGDSTPTINERVAIGRAQRTVADGAIVPPPHPFAKIPIPQALVKGEQAAMGHRIAEGYKAAGLHTYKDEDGTEMFAVQRYDHPDGRKLFLPLRCLGPDSDGRTRYSQTAVEAPRPLYNLDQIASRGEAVLLFCEGEKAADAAGRLFSDMVATTWPNGATAVGTVDVRDVAGRIAFLWPDNDDVGRKAMQQMAAKLTAAGAIVRNISLPPCYPDKWDLADEVPDGIPREHQPAALLAAAWQSDPFTPGLAKTSNSAGQGKPTAPPEGGGGDIARGFHAARFLKTAGIRDYAGYADWFDLMCAAKNTYGDAAFGEFVTLSNEFGGTDTDEQFRRKWDGIDARPGGARKTMATFFKEAIEAGWQDPAKEGAGGVGERGGRSDPASLVLEQSAEAGDALWTNQHGKAHVTMLVQGADGNARTVHARVGGKRHKGAVSLRYRAANKNKVLSAEQEKRAMLLLEHDAREGGIVHESANRAALHEGCIYVDLGRTDNKLARISAEGWTITENADVRFVRGSRGELPLPLPGGTLADFERHLNLNARDVVRVVAFVLGALAPLASFPILLIEGRQGTAKSTIGDMVLLLCDPPHGAKGARLTMPRGEQNLLVHASGVRVVYVDNVSDVSSAEADSLCRLATGGGTSARQHYSDEDEVQLNAVRPTVVTCIGTPTGRGDFLDRCIRVTAQPIALRRTEEAVHRAFEADRPKMLGFVFDALASALRNKPNLDAQVEAGELRLVRMADFALYVEGAAEHLGLEVGAFSSTLADEAAYMQAEGALGDPLGEVIARFFSAAGGTRTVLEGHATEVLDVLRGCMLDPPDLPASNKLKGALRRIEPGLADLCITVEVGEPHKGTRNRKTWYRIAAGEGFQRIGEELPF
jgi:hypothetical protein